jgi:glutaredoxin-like YruB-family protein
MADKKVVVYSTPTCPWCHKTKDYLTQKGVAFEDYDVGSDKERAKEMVDKSKQMAVPVIIFDDKDIVVGFNQGKLDELIAK